MVLQPSEHARDTAWPPDKGGDGRAAFPLVSLLWLPATISEQAEEMETGSQMYASGGFRNWVFMLEG